MHYTIDPFITYVIKNMRTHFGNGSTALSLWKPV